MNRKILRKNLLSIFILLIIFIGVFSVVNVCHAGWVDDLGNKIVGGLTSAFDSIIYGLKVSLLTIIGLVVNAIIFYIGIIFRLGVNAITTFAEYSNFINEVQIIKAWTIVRDFCNMFFILLLLFVAFATIFRVENYSIKKLLPKILIMAILINFSRMICGLIIDFSQIIMLTILDTMTVNSIVNALNVDAWLEMVSGNKWEDDTNFTSNLAGYVLAITFATIATIVVLIALAVIVIRIVMLWIYIVISPLAFFLSAWPGGQKYASEWWSEFIKQVVTGPLLIFFLWLALSMVGTGGSSDINLGNYSTEGLGEGNQNCFGPLAIACPQNFVHFILGIGMLLGGLAVTAKAGGAAGSMAGNALGKIKTTGVQIGMLPLRGAKEAVGYGVDKLHEKTGVDLNLGRVWEGMKEKRAERKQERYMKGMGKAKEVMEKGGPLSGLLAMTGAPGDAWEQIATVKGWRQRNLGGKGMAKKRAGIQSTIDENEDEVDFERFQANFMQAGLQGRNQALIDVISREDELDEQIEEVKSSDAPEEEKKKKIEELERQKAKNARKREYAEDNRGRKFSQKEIDKVEKSVKKRDDKIEAKKAEYDRYIPTYAYETRAAQDKAVSAKMDKIKNVTDGDELLRILNEAIREKDSNMVKAITKKMTQQGDENEFLKKFAGRTDAKGLQAMMGALSGEFSVKTDKDKQALAQKYGIDVSQVEKMSKMNVGMNDQEAMELGSDISMMCKGTNHWSVTGAYKMENGMWREANDQEVAQYSGVETGKMYTQEMVRKFNRLAFGFHDTKGDFHINLGGIEILKNLDSEQGVQEIGKNMQPNSAQRLVEDKGENGLDNLVKRGVISKQLAVAIQERAKPLPRGPQIDQAGGGEVKIDSDISIKIDEVTRQYDQRLDDEMKKIRDEYNTRLETVMALDERQRIKDEMEDEIDKLRKKVQKERDEEIKKLRKDIKK